MIAKNKRIGVLRDNYTLEFLNFPDDHKEKDLRRSILVNLKRFVFEFGKDFSLKLPDKKLLQEKLAEITDFSVS